MRQLSLRNGIRPRPAKVRFVNAVIGSKWTFTMKRNSNANGSGALTAHASRAGTDGRGHVWRISEQAPQGEWVKRGAQRESQGSADDPLLHDANWAMSSWDLLTGVTVVETSGPGQDELLKEFFAKAGRREGR
jgi:hypothetical protein